MSQSTYTNRLIPDIEQSVLSFWSEDQTFEKSLHKNIDKKKYIFYDGPPFATGLPHHGHLLASTIKDIIPRYKTMQGYYVSRRFGWDCHGLPIEHEIDKKYGKSSHEIVKEIGIGEYNNACRQIIMRYRDEWYKTIHRMGRWVDFENDYKTMDCDFMESVWWVFGELYDKGLIYKGNKVVPFSTELQTPLSNFEAGSNYQQVQDPAVTIKFPLADNSADLVIWTTTPWTLPANMGIGVNPSITYLQIRVEGEQKPIIVAQSRVEHVIKQPYTIEKEFEGHTLAGKKYLPVFAQLQSDHQNVHCIFCDSFVTTEDGTGLVHLAPAFGEDDQRVLSDAGINDLFCHVDEKGNFDDSIDPLFTGRNVFETNSDIIKYLKEAEYLYDQKTIDHSYPHCPRSDTKLIYKAVSSWYVSVSKFKDALVKNLIPTHWMPEHIKDKRFANWLENARDWAISRNRFWGNPIPLWINDVSGKILCMNSLEKLERYTGRKIDDLHREIVDDLRFQVKGEVGVYHRTSEVLDCWFESGAMPFAQNHYPFAGQAIEDIFPADFIAEGLDQTRGWFYTLHVIATALFDKAAYKNVNVNGIILASDGKKMSKRLKNYTPPDLLIEEHGADPLRLYLINSNLVKAEEMRFVDQGIKEMSRKVIMPWYNSFCFFKTYAEIDQWKRPSQYNGPTHILDKWIISRIQSLKWVIENAMGHYALYKVVPELVKFIDEMTNTYIRLNRSRFWQSGMNADKQSAYVTLFDICQELSQLMAPFCPFMSEHIFRELQVFADCPMQSVHLTSYPTADQKTIDQSLEHAVALMSDVIVLGRQKRNDTGIKIKTPLSRITIIHHDEKVLGSIKQLSDIIAKELNVKSIEFDQDDEKYIKYQAIPNAQVLGKQFGKDFKIINQTIRNLSHTKIRDILQTKYIAVNNINIDLDNIFIKCHPHSPDQVNSNNHIAILLDTTLSEALKQEGYAREFVSAIQKARKDAQLNVQDRIHVSYEAKQTITQFINAHQDYIQNETLCTRMEYQNNTPHTISIQIDDFELKFSISVAD
tara:strand:+ start:325 stop:3441 length:3117 start_codon:yes stop_codon:yes gene_type:complete